VPSATWCRDHESCHTLADYLRRRTNIAQWLPRGGLGAHDEHLPATRAVAERHGLRIVEDASHAHGASWRGRPCGSLGDVSVFSLQGDKLAPAGEGGVLLCDDERLYERAVCLGDITRIIELEGPARRFAATSFGIKTRMAPLSAAVGRVQLRHLAERNARRAANLEYLSRLLEPLGFDTFLPPAHIRRTYFEFIVRARPGRVALPLDRLIEALRAEGCRVSAPRYPLLHQQPIFTEGRWREIARLPVDVPAPDYASVRLPHTEAVGEELLRLPSFPSASQALLDQYAEAFRKVLAHAEAIGEARAA
jgi:dTDP-4-amino-4,6-dideoxygalactose transaminase